MDFIRTATTETTHARVCRLTPKPGERLDLPKALTWCGRKVFGRTGSTIAPGIDCENCRRVMRTEGYLV